MMAARSKGWRLILTEITLIGFLAVDLVLVTAELSLRNEVSGYNETQENNYVRKSLKLLEQNNKPRYEHEWPDLRFGWKIVVGSILGFLGAAFGSVGGVGGGGIFVPMLALVIGSDPKSSTAISKCGLGIVKMIKRIERNEYMGFDDICLYQP